jgi:hypothetical protein
MHRRYAPTTLRRTLAHALAAAALAITVAPVVTAEEPSVRDEFAAGMRGDEAAFDRAMKRAEAVLAKDPKNAEALVWHGAGTLALAGRAFMSGNFQEGGRLWSDATREMDDAVAIAPNDPAVLVVRGSTLLEASRHLPAPDQARALLEKGVGDYEKALAVQTPDLARVPLESRCQLLFGLADGWDRLGDREKGRAFYQRVSDECKGTGFAAEAGKRLAAR